MLDNKSCFMFTNVYKCFKSAICYEKVASMKAEKPKNFYL